MTVYGSSRDQSQGPDEPRRPPPGDQPEERRGESPPWSADPTGTTAWGEPPPDPPYSPGAAAPRHSYRDQGTGNAYGDQGAPDRYGTGAVRGDQGRGQGYGPEDLYADAGRRRPTFEPTSYGSPPAGRPPSGSASVQPPAQGPRWQELTGPGAGAGTPARPGPPGPEGPPATRLKAPRVTGARRTAIIVGAVAVLVIGAGTAAAATLLGGSGSPSATGSPPSRPQGTVAGAASGSPPAQGAGAPVGPAEGITLSATGDVVMGMAPTGLPPNNGKGFFDPVKSALTADLQMGNLEQTITDDTGVSKCGAASAGKTCFAFRTPPAFVQNLKDAGFGLMNEANNHAYDFGPTGYQNTRHNLDSVGIKYTGWPGEIPVVDVKGVKVAVVGFASYTWSNLCSDLTKATSLVKQAKAKADLVVIQVHQGGEGADKTHVKPGTEFFLGENRCDPIAFAHNAIDAGADLVIGHGPHVMRAMEFYKGHLIAYSMGNFAGYHALTVNGVLAVGGVLHVTLLGDGTFKDATLTSTKLVAPGSPRLDPQKQAISLVGGLSKSDFPTTGANISADGAITAP